MTNIGAETRPEVLVVELARRGDREAFAELIERHQAWIRNLMWRCCNHAALADDLAQQVFMQAWRDIPKLRQPHSFQGWLRRLAMNIWHQHLRKKDILTSAEPDEALNKQTTSDSVGEVTQELDLNRALATLSADVRQCIVLSYAEGMSHREVAEVSKLPIGTVKSHIRRGSARLKELLAEYQGNNQDPATESTQ